MQSPPLPPDFEIHQQDNRTTWYLGDLQLALRDIGFFAGEPNTEPTRWVQGRAEHPVVSLGGDLRAIWKRCRRGGLMEPLLKDLHRGWDRFRNELELTEQARAAGVRVPRILAVAIEDVRGPWCRVELLCELLDGVQDGQDLLQRSDLDPERRNAVLMEAARAIRHYHGLGFLHGDLNVKNILWRDAETQLDVAPGADGRTVAIEVHLIDLDPNSARRGGGGHTALHNMLRLARSYWKGIRSQAWQRLPQSAELRFVREYFRGDRHSQRDFLARVRRQLQLRSWKSARKPHLHDRESAKP